MTSRLVSRPIGVLTAALFLGITGCERDVTMLEPAPFPTDSEVFLDAFGPGVDYDAFGGSKVTALDISFLVTYQGSRSLQFTVPNFGDPEGSFAGGAFTSSGGRDLTGYNALEFWAKSSMPATLGLVGIGNDLTGSSLYGAQVTDLPLTTIWERYVVPIPLPDKLAMERGLFEVASGPADGAGYELWFDEVQYVNDPTITNARPAIRTQDLSTTVGSTVNVDGTVVTYDVDGREVTVQASPYYFTFGSSDASVATVAEDGTITVVGTGTATITATLGSVAADGAVTVTAVEGPSTAAPTPTRPAENVISLFSNAYTNVFVDRWAADFDPATVEDVVIDGSDTKLYTNLGFAVVEFTSEPIDATAMTGFHMDVWTFDSSEFKVKL
ncbi:MAG: carbohydrate-binding protein, partial [Gemmatimonadota bacterium]